MLKRHWVGFGVVAIGAALGIWLGVAAGEDDGSVALTRNEIARGSAGDAMWHGAFTNRTGDLHRNLYVEIRFLDSRGRPLGSVGGRAERLQPGESLTLDVPLPPRAVSVQLSALRWRMRDVHAELGPYKPWPFGYLQA
jgi:hypothetical protein